MGFRSARESPGAVQPGPQLPEIRGCQDIQGSRFEPTQSAKGSFKIAESASTSAGSSTVTLAHKISLSMSKWPWIKRFRIDVAARHGRSQ